MKIRISTLVLLCAVILSAVFVAGRVSVHPKVDRLSTALKSMNDSIAYKDIIIDGLTQRVAQKDALVLTYKEALNAEIISKEEMRRMHIRELNSKTSLIAELNSKLDSISHTGQVVYDTIYIKDTLSLVPSIRLPFTFSKVTAYTSLKGSFNREGIMSAEVSVKAPLDIYVGLAKKTKDTKVSVTSPNPDLNVVYINSLKVVEPDKKWYQREILGDAAKVGLGILIGRATK
jgi:outer membrane murein-binding lipoprotein Lpp